MATVSSCPPLFNATSAQPRPAITQQTVDLQEAQTKLQQVFECVREENNEQAKAIFHDILNQVLDYAERGNDHAASQLLNAVQNDILNYQKEGRFEFAKTLWSQRQGWRGALL